MHLFFTISIASLIFKLIYMYIHVIKNNKYINIYMNE